MPAVLSRARRNKLGTTTLFILLVGSAVSYLGCGKVSTPPAVDTTPRSAIAVTVNPGKPVVIKSATAEFDILSSGYVQPFLLKDGNRLSLDEPEVGPGNSSDVLLIAGKEIRDFALDLDRAKISDAHGRLGVLGKRVEITGHSLAGGAADIEKLLAVEVYDDFPTVAVTTVNYKNVGGKEIKLDKVVTQRRRLNAALAGPAAAPYDLWSFQGSSYDWGKDEILRISKGFSQPNVIGGPGPKGQGGGIPVIDFWTAKVGVAIGHLETLPLVLSLPVKVGSDGRIGISMLLEPNSTLKPGEAYSTSHSFIMVHPGDFYESLRLWSSALERQGWTIPKPTNADYSANWCSWGYEANFTPAQMLGTIPKLKELNLPTATLDYCWFDNFGDWQPRSDTFPRDSIKKVVDEYHKQGILITLWWQPLGVEDGQGKPSLGKPMTTAKLVAQHPDWMILDKNGKRARLISPVCTVAAMCPALPEVRQYHKELTERFIRDWGFDGNKMDSVFSVPPCYNPTHRHKSPEDSTNAVADVYRVIFETTRSLKPDSITQICPCGTTPNLAWLPYMDQAVTADPVGSVQVRRRIKMYKALLGPQSAVYGDHVELSGMKRVGNEWLESGKDFASTVGTGGVVGTKFTWPGDAPDPRLRKVKLTSEKESLWKKWIDLYNAKMLSRGTFRNLYLYGYDVPEGYAIEKGGRMYYAFFSPDPEKPWRGEIELRGLQAGNYRVLDYENGKELGSLDSRQPRLTTEFMGHLLLEVSSQ
jgi:alpha-galactosidase